MNTQRKSEHNPEANDPHELTDANLRGELAWMLKVLREESEDWSPAAAVMFGMYLDSLYDESKRRGHEPLNACAALLWDNAPVLDISEVNMGDGQERRPAPQSLRWVFGKPGGWPFRRRAFGINQEGWRKQDDRYHQNGKG
jgi:hypothetical protein